MKLPSSLLAFVSLIQGIDCRLSEPSSPVKATEKNEFSEDKILSKKYDFLSNIPSTVGHGDCEKLEPDYYGGAFSEDAIHEFQMMQQSVYSTGVLDMTDSQYYVPEYIENACGGTLDEDGNPGVTYFMGMTGSPACVGIYFNDNIELGQWINLPKCFPSSCTDDDFDNIPIENDDKYSEDIDSRFICTKYTLTITSEPVENAKESIISIE